MNRAEIISRLRNSIKEVSADTKYTNRFLWNIFWTNARILLKQESDKGRLYNQNDIWETICVKMDKVSPLLCECLKLPMDCIVYRSRFKIPKITEGYNGKLYRFISSADLSNELVLVTPYTFGLKKTKYNNEKYVFIHDGYLWAPDTKWSHLIISAVFEEEIPNEFKCNCDDEGVQEICGSLLYLNASVPDYSIQPAIQMSLQELGFSKQIISDQLPNVNENEK